MKIRDVMSTPAITVEPDAPFTAVVDTLLANGISGAPVVDDDEHLLGIVTEADLVSREAYGYRRRRALGLVAELLRGRDPQWVRKGAARTAEELMTPTPVVASPDDDLGVVARHMLESRHKRLPVVDGGRVVGVVTRHDLLRPFDRADSEIAAEVRRLLADPWRVPETHAVRPSVSDGVVRLDGDVQWPSDAEFFEAVVARIPGVVAVENHLEARLPEPPAR